jgi:hypothetical protein
MTCVAQSGCWYRPFDIAESMGESMPYTAPDLACYYVELGGKLPQAHRRIFQDSDPIDSFTGVWIDEHFGFSFDVTSELKFQLSPLTTDL